MCFLLPPFAARQIVFFIIFECICNAFAEFTYLGDRGFYEDWWNSTAFIEFSRKWNRPVHEFLLRHVYIASQDVLHFSNTAARNLTFSFSIVLHELVLWGVFGFISPWLAIFSCFQFPLISLMSTSLFKGKRLGNFVFWLGLLLGVPLIAVLYTFEYCAAHTDACRDIHSEQLGGVRTK